MLTQLSNDEINNFDNLFFWIWKNNSKEITSSINFTRAWRAFGWRSYLEINIKSMQLNWLLFKDVLFFWISNLKCGITFHLIKHFKLIIINCAGKSFSKKFPLEETTTPTPTHTLYFSDFDLKNINLKSKYHCRYEHLNSKWYVQR